MKSRILLLPAFALVFDATAPMVLAQGALTPTGPPGASMKRLDQIRPGTPIDSAPFTIAEPGPYYLTGNVDATSIDNAIQITASNVTFDLNGFRVTSESGAGIVVFGGSNTEAENIVVRNGSVHSGSAGVDFRNVRNSLIEDLSVISNSSSGISIRSFSGQSSGNQIRHCAVMAAVGGINFVAFTDATCKGNTVRSSVAEVTGGFGSGVEVLGFGEANGNLIEDCLTRAFDDPGIAINAGTFDGGGSASGNRIRRCTAINSPFGVRLESTNGGIVEGNDVSLCTASSNVSTAIGFQAIASPANQSTATARANRFFECVAHDGRTGFQLKADSGARCIGNAILGCLASGGSTFGISVSDSDGNRIQDNHVFEASGAIRGFNSQDNIYTGNTVGGSTTFGIAIDATDTEGPTVTTSGVLPSTGSPAHPWANFER